MFSARSLFLATLALALALVSVPRDTDIGIPAGSALFWTRAFPAYTPPREGLFAKTPSRTETKGASERSSSKPGALELDFRNGDGFGLVRILTTDLPIYFSWMRAKPPGPGSGATEAYPERPEFGSGLYWVTLAPLLRLMLHPQIVPYEPALAHVLEIGEPALYLLNDLKTERGLRSAVEDLRMRLEPGKGTGTSRPLDGETVRERMFSRFCLDELLRIQAYDPERSFAKRLLLFSEETEDWVVRYAREGNLRLRRAAIAALGRYRSKRALDMLLERAIFSRDAVETVRALAGLSNYRGPFDVTPLVQRLLTEEDPILQSALCGPLGRPQATAAIEPLMALVENGIKEHDTGVAIEALGALIRIGRHKESEPRLLAFLEKAERKLAGSSASFKVPGGPLQANPNPDSERDRAQVLLALVRILWLQLHPGDARATEMLFEMADQGRRGFGPEGAGFGNIHAPARLAFLAALPSAGEAGIARLRAIAESSRFGAALRGQALRRLPYLHRSKLAMSFLAAPNAYTLRIIGYETLVADFHPEALALGHALIEEAASAHQDRAPSRDYLFLRAVRTLSERGQLEMLELAPLIFHAEKGADALGDLLDPIRERVDALVSDFVTQKKTLTRLKPDIASLVDFVIRAEFNTAVSQETRAEVIEYIEQEIRGLKSHRSDSPYIENVRKSIKTVILGWRPEDLAGPPLLTGRPTFGSGDFATPVDLGEEVLLALGRTQDPEAAAMLADFLGNRRNRNRAAACLGLGLAGFTKHVKTLASFLLDGEPFVRFCAYEALRHLTGLDVQLDWMYGPADERFDGAERYLVWALENSEPSRAK